MRTVYSIIILILFLSSCISKDTNFYSDNCVVDYTADNVIYALDMTMLDDYGYDVNHNGKVLFCVTKSLQVGNKNFGGWSNISKAFDFYRESNDKSKVDFYEITTIGIRKNGKFSQTWVWKNPIYVDDESGSFGIVEFNVFLDNSFVNYNDSLKSILHIHFKTKDSENGYKLYTLNYIFKDNYWELISKERINTIFVKGNYDKAYCIDTIIRNSNKPNSQHEKIELTDETIFDMIDAKCY